MVHCYKRNAFFAKHNALPSCPVHGMCDVIAKEQFEGLSGSQSARRLYPFLTNTTTKPTLLWVTHTCWYTHESEAYINPVHRNKIIVKIYAHTKKHVFNITKYLNVFVFWNHFWLRCLSFSAPCLLSGVKSADESMVHHMRIKMHQQKYRPNARLDAFH